MAGFYVFLNNLVGTTRGRGDTDLGSFQLVPGAYTFETGFTMQD